MRPIVNMLEEDQATDIGNMHKKFGEDRECDSGDMLTDRHTDRYTHHKYTNNRKCCYEHYRCSIAEASR